MELRDYLTILRKRWLVIVAATIVGLVIAGAVSLLLPKQYTASTQIFVSTAQSDNVTDLSTGNTFAQQRVKSYVTLVTSSRVLQPVITQLGLTETEDQLAEQITATAATNTVILEVSVTDRSPAQATAIASAVANTLPTVVTEIERADATGTSPVKLSTIQPAVEPLAASSPNVKLNLALGLLVGLALGIGLAVLLEQLDTRLRSLRDIAQLTDAIVLGGIAFDPESPQRPLVVHDAKHSPRAESFRSLRTNVQFATIESRNSFVITSALPGEGKTTTGANLAITMVEAGQKVLYVDADLRKPKVATYMGIEGRIGLTDVLLGNVPVEDAIQEWGEDNLHVLPAGATPPNPSELLGSKTMAALVTKLEAEYDIVVFDAPPVLPVTDAAILSRLTAGAILIVAASQTRRNQFVGALETLDKVEARILGVVLTKIPTKKSGAYGYGSYGYGAYGYGAYGGYYGEGDAAGKAPQATPAAGAAVEASTTNGTTAATKPAAAKPAAAKRGTGRSTAGKPGATKAGGTRPTGTTPRNG